MWSTRNIVITVIVVSVVLLLAIWSWSRNVTDQYQNILIGISAILTPLLAFLGFDSWKNEMHYKKLSDVSYRAISRIRELRESVQSARSNHITGPEWEMWRSMDDAPLPHIPNEFALKYERGINMALERLWSLIDMRHELSILWNGVLDKPLAEIRDHIRLLESTTSIYFGLVQLVFADKTIDKKEARDQFMNDEKILFSSEGADDYNLRLETLIKDVESHLQKYISS